jgi:hypothetical protein
LFLRVRSTSVRVQQRDFAPRIGQRWVSRDNSKRYYLYFFYNIISLFASVIVSAVGRHYCGASRQTRTAIVLGGEQNRRASEGEQCEAGYG